MGKTIKLTFLGVFLLIIAALAIHNNLKKIERNENSVSQKDKYISSNSREQLTLPDFSTVDIFGNTIDSSNFTGKKTFVQFINPKSESQIESLKRVYQEYKNEDFAIITFIKKVEDHIFHRFMDKIMFASGDIFIITEDYENHKTLFEAPSCCESFMLFGQEGKLIGSGTDQHLHKKDIRAYFNRLDAGKKFIISNYIKPGFHISDIDWLGSLARVIERENNYEYFIFSMFNNICTGCPSGTLINKLKEADKSASGSAHFLIILSDDYTENDVNNFKIHLEINFPVLKADEQLMNKWNQLIEEFSKIELNNIIFSVSKEGEILDTIMLNRWNEFFNNLSIITEIDQE